MDFAFLVLTYTTLNGQKYVHPPRIQVNWNIWQLLYLFRIQFKTRLLHLLVMNIAKIFMRCVHSFCSCVFIEFRNI